MVPQNHPIVQQVTQQVPQEVSAMSAMSEQDLISYINPSAFDQGNIIQQTFNVFSDILF